MTPRKICVVTGSRAEYGLLQPVMESIRSHPALELMVMATGMHLAEEFGKTADQITRDGFKIEYKLEMHPQDDSSEAMARSIGQGIIKMSEAFRRKRPDILVVLGDRTEALAAAVAGAYMNIPVAHIHGGDASMAGLDESARHAITKMAHLHFPATRLSMRRILLMGEDPKRVFLVGSPGLDSILAWPIPDRCALAKELGADLSRPFILVAQHPVTTQVNKVRRQIIETLKAIEALAMPTILIYPNSDAGGRAIIREIKKRGNWAFLRAFKNIAHPMYLGLLRHAGVLVGNSSSGIIEAPSFKLPVVNIGIRQQGRERSVNVLDVPHDRNAILKAIEKSLHDESFLRRVRQSRNPYGNGKAGQEIARVLSRVNLSNGLLQKQICY